MFAATPPEAYAHALEKSQVSPQALGVGYLVFFLYSAGIGVLAIVLVLIVAAKQPAHAAAVEKRAGA